MELLGPTSRHHRPDPVAPSPPLPWSSSAYGVDTDPGRLNDFLNANAGVHPQRLGLLGKKPPPSRPRGQVEKAYEDLPSYALIDDNLLNGNPVIVRVTLRNGTTHFLVVVGKQGWSYLVQDPARPPGFGVYPLKRLVPHIDALRFFRVTPTQ